MIASLSVRAPDASSSRNDIGSSGSSPCAASSCRPASSCIAANRNRRARSWRSRKPTHPLHSAQTPSNTMIASPTAGSGGFGGFKPALVADQPPAQRHRGFDLEGVAPFVLALAAIDAVEQRRRQRQHAEQLHAVDAPPQVAILHVQRE